MSTPIISCNVYHGFNYAADSSHFFFFWEDEEEKIFKGRKQTASHLRQGFHSQHRFTKL